MAHCQLWITDGAHSVEKKSPVKCLGTRDRDSKGLTKKKQSQEGLNRTEKGPFAKPN